MAMPCDLPVDPFMRALCNICKLKASIPGFTRRKLTVRKPINL